jgi:hypothetical protein
MHFAEEGGAYSAVVQGSKPYRVSVEARRYDYGHCECYLGQNNTLCKHMVAVAIRAVTCGKPLSKEEKTLTHQAVCSGQLGSLSKEELAASKKAMTAAMRYIKPYHGPSRIWFSCGISSRTMARLAFGFPINIHWRRDVIVWQRLFPNCR